MRDTPPPRTADFIISSDTDTGITFKSTIRQFLLNLPSVVDYAIERGLSTLDQPFVSDLDIVVSKQGFMALYGIARQQGLVVSVTLSYGGARLFLEFKDGTIKRIDCMWDATYMGIPLCSTRRLLNSRLIDPATKLYVLPERMQAEVVFAVKNAHGGTEKYQELLERHGLRALTAGVRRRWLLSLLMRQPLTSLVCLFRTILVYSLRMIFPSGITIHGTTDTMLGIGNCVSLRYLFQDRIRAARTVSAFLRSRLMAELCLIRSRAMADIDLTADPRPAENAVLDFLRRRRARIPRLLALLA